MEVEGIIAQGHPAEEIIKYAEENLINLIVMGTLGKSGLERFLMGGVSDKVIRNSKIPVIAVPEIKSVWPKIEENSEMYTADENGGVLSPISMFMMSNQGGWDGYLSIW